MGVGARRSALTVGGENDELTKLPPFFFTRLLAHKHRETYYKSYAKTAKNHLLAMGVVG